MQRWEHQIVDVTDDEWYEAEGQEAVLNRYGAEGWELATIYVQERATSLGVYAYFKRPVMSTEAGHA